MKTQLFLLFFLFYVGIHSQVLNKKNLILLDDFEDKNLQSKLAGEWLGITDKDKGGSSRARLTNVRGGDLSLRCVKFEYQLGERFKENNNFQNPYAVLALMVKQKHMEYKDISKYQGVHFSIKREGIYGVILVIKTEHGVKICYKKIDIKTPYWKRVMVNFRSFHDFQPWYLKKVVAFGIADFQAFPRKKGTFFVDNFSMIKKSPKIDKDKKVKFGTLLIDKPKEWNWQKDKTWQLSHKKTLSIITFIALERGYGSYIHFSDGLRAHINRPKQLIKCTKYELEKLGFINIRALGRVRKRLKKFRTRRFFFEACFSQDFVEKHNLDAKELFLQVDFIKSKRHYYEIVSFWFKKDSHLTNKVRKIIYNLGTY